MTCNFQKLRGKKKSGNDEKKKERFGKYKQTTIKKSGKYLHALEKENLEMIKKTVDGKKKQRKRKITIY